MNPPLPTLDALPESFVLPLNNVSAIRLTGEEQVKYLQGQVTCDVSELTEQHLLRGAHCDAKGKVLSVFRLIEQSGELLLIQPQSTIEKSLAELQKFGVFAKVTIEQTEQLAFACFVGEQGETAIKQHFNAIPDKLTPVIHHQGSSVIYLAGNVTRFLVVGQQETVQTLIADSKLAQLASDVWQLLEITEGFPLLPANHVQQFVPQMLNLDKIAGISFTKGCYLGQETVARMQYLGKNKKIMAFLSGQNQAQITTEPAIEKQLGENWRSAGDVLSYYQADNGDCYLQAVVANDLTADDCLRFKQQENSALQLSALPYQ